MKRVSRSRVPARFLAALQPYEEEHLVDGYFYVADLGDGEWSAQPVYAHSTHLGRDFLVRIEDASDDHRGPMVDLLDLGEGGLGGHPVYVALRRAIYEDAFDQCDFREDVLGYMQGRGAT